MSLQHGHPRPCRGELSKHVHGDARPAGDEDADVVRFQIRSNHRFGERGSSGPGLLRTNLTTRFGLQGGRRPRVVVEGRERTRHSFLCCRSVTSRDMCITIVFSAGLKRRMNPIFWIKKKREIFWLGFRVFYRVNFLLKSFTALLFLRRRRRLRRLNHHRRY